MNSAIKRIICRRRNSDGFDSELQRMNFRNSPSQAPTALCRFNGSITPNCVRRSQFHTTLV